MDFDLDEVIATFVDEAEESLALGEASLLALEVRPQDEEALANAFRVVHNLKGNAAFLGFEEVTELAHVTEDVLDDLRQGKLLVTGDMITLLLGAVDALGRRVAATPTGQEALDTDERSLIDALSKVASRSAEAQAEEDPGACDEAAGADPATHWRQAALAPSLRVAVHKLDRLLDVAGEIGIARGQLKQRIETEDLDRRVLIDTVEAADFLYHQLQELVMELRMVPVGPTFRSLRRRVRDLARAQGKRAELEIEGAEVEVDTRVIEQLRDPLNHMIRNAIDHGIETPEERRAVGKEPGGRVTLRACHDADTLVIELTDDGAGLDHQRIWRQAVTQGLAGGDPPSPAEVEKLVFTPGFSTASEVSKLSGRGVGMDVLRRNIKALRGDVRLSSAPGRGTTVTIQLPLTLAIIDGLQVRVGNESYILPLEVVHETLGFDPQGQAAEARGVLHVRGEVLPYARLRELLRLDGPVPERQSLVVVGHGAGRAGLVVDEAVGECHTVIKPLARILQGIGGLMGSAILGNGRVAFILDVSVLLRQAEEDMTTAVAT